METATTPIIATGTFIGIALAVLVILLGIAIIYIIYQRNKLKESSKLRRAETTFFNKYANLNDEFRTVTITEAVKQVLSQIDYNFKVQKIKEEKAKQEQEQEQEKEKEKEESPIPANHMVRSVMHRMGGNVRTGEEEEDPNTPSVAELSIINGLYENYLEDLGIDLNKICKCPDGDQYCDWGASMFEQFIVNTAIWNLVSIKIYRCDFITQVCDSIPMSSSSISDTTGPDGSIYRLVTMSNQAGIQALKPGDLVLMVIQWLDNDVPAQLHSTSLYNVIEGVPASSTVST